MERTWVLFLWYPLLMGHLGSSVATLVEGLSSSKATFPDSFLSAKITSRAIEYSGFFEENFLEEFWEMCSEAGESLIDLAVVNTIGTHSWTFYLPPIQNNCSVKNKCAINMRFVQGEGGHKFLWESYFKFYDFSLRKACILNSACNFRISQMPKGHSWPAGVKDLCPKEKKYTSLWDTPENGLHPLLTPGICDITFTWKGLYLWA